MISLIKTELKKIFKNSFYKILILVVLIFPLGITLGQEFQQSGIDDNGNIISGINVKKEIIKVKRNFSGEITEEWMKKHSDLYEKTRYTYLMSILDYQKMEEIYGPNWKTEVPITKKDTELYFQNWEQRNTSKMMLSSQILDDALDYGNFILNKKWEDYDIIENSYHGFVPNSNKNSDKSQKTENIIQEEKLLKNSFRQKETFYYGETETGDLLLNSLKNGGVILGYAMLILFATIFNNDLKEERIALIRSTKHGKRKIIIAKIITTILVAIAIPITMFIINFGIISLLFGTPNLQASYFLVIAVKTSRITALTMGEAIFKGLGLLIAGSLMISLISMTLSAFIKSTYHTLIIGFVLFVVPLALGGTIGTFPIKALLPIEFMNYSSELLVSTASIDNKAFFQTDLVFIVALIPFLLIPIAYYFEKRREVYNR